MSKNMYPVWNFIGTRFDGWTKTKVGSVTKNTSTTELITDKYVPTFL